MSRTATKRKSKSVALCETVYGYAPLPDGTSRVDRDGGRIRGVRICGTQSDNGRVYTVEALRNAIPLYEGAKVKISHPANPGDERPFTDTFGWLEGVRQGDDGALYGDLCFLKSHKMAAEICEAAERNPNLLGLSHNADGRGETGQDGTLHVTEIVHLRSVDIVDHPATNSSLFESRGKAVKKTWKEFFESYKADPKRGPIVKVLLEDDLGMSPTMDEPMPADLPAEDAGAGDWKADLVAAIGKLVSSEDDADHKMAQKIMAMLKPAAIEPAIVEADPEDDKDKDKAMESLKAKVTAGAKQLLEATQENDRLKRDAQVFAECSEARFTPDDVQREALVGMADPAKRKRLIESLKGAALGNRPRSIGHGTLNGNGATNEIAAVKDGESVAKFLTRRR